MNMDKMTIKLRSAIAEADRLAGLRSNAEVTTEHLVLALLGQEDGILTSILERVSVSPHIVEGRFEKRPIGSAKHTVHPPSARSAECLQNQLYAATTIAGEFKDEYLSAEHVLLAIIRDNSAASGIFKELGLTNENVMQALQAIRGNTRIDSEDPESRYEALEVLQGSDTACPKRKARSGNRTG